MYRDAKFMHIIHITCIQLRDKVEKAIKRERKQTLEKLFAQQYIL